MNAGEILLWLFVADHAIAVGAGAYENRVVLVFALQSHEPRRAVRMLLSVAGWLTAWRALALR